MDQVKWQKEISTFYNLYNILVLTDNIFDFCPVIDSNGSQIRGYPLLEEYVCNFLVNNRYACVIGFDPINGFYEALSDNHKKICGLQVIEEIIEEERKQPDAQKSQKVLFPYETKKYGENYYIKMSCLEDVAQIIRHILTQREEAIGIVMNYASRYLARPDDMDEAERNLFLNLQQAALHAKGAKKIFLLTDKLNDLPVWFYYDFPLVKVVPISKPDYIMRDGIIRSIADRIAGYSQMNHAEKENFIRRFVGSTEGMIVRDLVMVYQIAIQQHIDAYHIDDAVMLHKYGVKDNPWTKLDPAHLVHLVDKLEERVIGQRECVLSAVDVIKRAALGMSGLQHSSAISKPRGVLFLAGPTGTGKTELAKTIAEQVFLDERNMIRFDMSEYREAHSDQRLLGAPPGYVGYEAGGQLTNAVREHPFSILLFDEIEKAHPSLLDKFLQILEDGRITDGRGETVYFQNCLIVFTSNLGMTKPDPHNPEMRIPIVTYQDTTEDVKEKVLSGVRDYFERQIGRPELLNRIGNNILIFDYIRENAAKKILYKQYTSIVNRILQDKHIHVELSEKAYAQLEQKTLQQLPKGEGGRGIGNLIEQAFINPLSRYLFDQSVRENTSIIVNGFVVENNHTSLEIIQK